MQSRPLSLAAKITMLVALCSATAAYSHEFPKAAKKITATLVQHYAECTAPDAVTNGGAQACLETEPVDTVCTFPGAGSGKVVLSVSKTSIKAKANLQGLAPTCEGQTLAVHLGVRATTDDCTGGHCTTVDQTLIIGSCTVTGGKCALSGESLSGYPEDAGSALQVTDCVVGRAGFDSFSCGLLVP